MRPLIVGLVGAAAITVGVLLVRNARPGVPSRARDAAVPAGETHPGTISLERLRELGY